MRKGQTNPEGMFIGFMAGTTSPLEKLGIKLKLGIWKKLGIYMAHV